MTDGGREMSGAERAGADIEAAVAGLGAGVQEGPGVGVPGRVVAAVGAARRRRYLAAGLGCAAAGVVAIAAGVMLTLDVGGAGPGGRSIALGDDRLLVHGVWRVEVAVPGRASGVVTAGPPGRLSAQLERLGVGLGG